MAAELVDVQVPTVAGMEVGADLKSPIVMAAEELERTASQDIRQERDDLKEAAEQTLNVILDLGLDGTVRWVSPSWADVVGTTPQSLQGKPIADILLDNASVFAEAVESLKRDDSRSQIIRFTVKLGPLSKLSRRTPIVTVDPGSDETTADELAMEQEETIVLEGQGIMVYDRSSGGESHTMWMIRPSPQPREITIDLPSLLVESLGVGAEMLAQYLNYLAEEGANDPGNNAPPLPVLCRICERQIEPWWFEKHTDLCLQEHRAEMEVQLAQENLVEQRHAIVKVLDTLEARNSRPTSGETGVSPPPQAEYKGLPIGPISTPPSGGSSGAVSPAAPLTRSREPSASGLGHVRTRSFAVRRPLARIVELVLDLCDTAIEISTPAIRDPSSTESDMRSQSPRSESRISQVLQWQSPSTSTLDQERGLAALCTDTENAARAKVQAVLRHRRIMEYAERIRVEFLVMVQDCVDAALRKAARIAAGESSESSDDGGGGTAEDDGTAPPGSLDAPPRPLPTLRSISDPSFQRLDRRRASTQASSRSSSPRECPTPRSSKGPTSVVGLSHQSKRTSMYIESDVGDSDSSMRSSLLAGLRRTESSASECAPSRASSRRGRHRTSIILPTGAASPGRQPSPGKDVPPASPLRMKQPRLSGVFDALQSPITSPILSGAEPYSPILPMNCHSHQQNQRRHRRQSSAASTDVSRPTASPRLNPVGQPQARAVAPSIKDFEIIKPISKGAFGSVYLSRKKSTGEYFAIKVLKKADMVAKNQVTNVKAERAIMMRQGESDFVAKLYWTFSSKDYLYLVMEYLNGGDCASLIKVLGGLPEDWSKRYLAEVVLCVQDLHKRGIVHRDLKPDNLLIDQNGHLKLTDFGLSRMGLVGRQKRVLNGKDNESVPDLLRHGPFVRPQSIPSSRSASFDFHGNHSPGSTPQMTPDVMGGLALPSYFNLSREYSASREQSRRTSGYRSDSGGSETLQAIFNNFSLGEPSNYGMSPRKNLAEEETRPEGGDSPDSYPLQTPDGFSNLSQHHDTPPQTQTGMMPPPMALFDPEDNTRRFVGTPDYLAPETIKGVGQDEMSDWWSVGCILFELLYGYPPFHADSPDKVFENILERRIDWPSDEDAPTSAEAKDLMNRLMCLDPRQRLGSNANEKYSCGGEEIRNHPWFEGIKWDTLYQDEAQFIPAPEHPEDTEYFDARGATLQSFTEELEDQASSPAVTPGGDFLDRPHDALSKVRTQMNTTKRGLMPLHIPPHVRDNRSRRLSEPVPPDDFGTFTFKNLPVLEKANKDVLQKLRAEAVQSQNRAISAGSSVNSPALSQEGSPVLQIPVKRQVSGSNNHNRSVSPSNMSQANASPCRTSQPTSPLLVSFSAGQHHQRRKTSSTSSTLSHPSTGSLQPGSFFEVPRLAATIKAASTASSPVKHAKIVPPLPLSPQKGPVPRQLSGQSPRARSQTVGSQEGDAAAARDSFAQHKRRSGIFEMSPSSSDNEDTRASALLRVQRRRQSSRRKSAHILMEGPVFRPLDILVGEDHPVSRMVMEKLLEKVLCRTITVTNGSEALRYATSEIKFDIIMLEIKLPQINGADVARMIRDTKNTNSRTPIVAVTGYLKELQAPHHFDAMIEKPPTSPKLIEVMTRLCQWRPPPSGYDTIRVRTAVPSGLRQESIRSEDSPSSASSGFPQMPGATYHGSSREDSISSSFFGDFESINADEGQVIVGKGTEDWTDGGLGISEEGIAEPKQTPHLIQQHSAPPALQSKFPVKRRSAEKVRAKREMMKGQQSGESGDDEDEELGDMQVRAKSPQRTENRTSKLGTEMLRTNSRGSVVSGSEMSFKDCITAPTPAITQVAPLSSHHLPSSLLAPSLSAASSEAVLSKRDPDITPPSSIRLHLSDEDPTPRARSALPTPEERP